MFFIKCDYILITLRNVVLETMNNIVFIFNSYLVITSQSWHIHFISLIWGTYLLQLRKNSTRKRMGHLVPQKSLL